MSVKRNLFRFCVFFICLLYWAPALVAEAAEPDLTLILQLVEGVDGAELASEYQVSIIDEVAALDLIMASGFSTELAQTVSSDSRIAAVFDNAMIEGQPRYVGMVGFDYGAEAWGNDDDLAALYFDQLATDQIRLEAAHEIATGDGVTVAVLDTGIDFEHPLLEGKVVPGYDFVDEDDDPSEERSGGDQDGDYLIDEGAGHGTHIAGIIALTAPDAKIMPLRIFDDDGNGAYFDTIEAIIYAADAGVDVINLSGSGADNLPYMKDAIDYALAREVVVIAAGGVNSLGYPARYENVISVGATESTDYPAHFAKYRKGPIDLYAPGIDIFSSFDQGRFATWTGNSMAAPFVAGTAALMTSTGSCDLDCVRLHLVEGAHAVVHNNKNRKDPHGRLDVFDAVAFAAQQPMIDLYVEVGHITDNDPNDHRIVPAFNLINEGNTVELEDITLRYWFMPDGDAPQRFHCEWAAVSCKKVKHTFGIFQGEDGLDTYLELSFKDGAGTLYGGHASDLIQVRVNKNDWSPYDEWGHYSYDGSSEMVENEQVTVYYKGELIWGREP